MRRMTTKWAIWVSVLALCALPACGSDDDDDDSGGGGSGGTGNSGGSAGSGNTGGGDTGGGGSGGSGGGTGGAGGAVTDACTNDSDLAAIMAMYGGMAGAGGAGMTFSEIVADCGLTCLADNQDDIPAVVACTEECVSERTDDAVSDTCTGCFTESALCAFNNCIARCAADPAAAGCLACRCNEPDSGNTGDVNCEARFAECSGVDRNTCG